ncbi:MAG: hypothetical protein HOM21_06320, partial [Halobacteriovoraceae bacterium]|nr:hypothetical protein [Halobacteriovoraceae bacterium]
MIRGTDFRKIAEHYKEKLCKIKVCAFDLDGVLTAGDLQYQGQEMQWNRTFHALDGYGFKILMKAGLKVGIITGGDSQSVIERFEKNLTVDFVYRGNEDKREGFKKILDMGYSPEEILYMGDEFFDLPLLKAAGFSVT